MQNGVTREMVDEEDSSEEEPEELVKIEEIPAKETPVKETEECPKKECCLSKSAAKRLKRKQKKEAEKAKKVELEESEENPKKQKLNVEIKPSAEAKSPDLKTSVKSPEEKIAVPKKKRIRRFSNGYIIENLHFGPETGDVTAPGKKVTIKYVGKLEGGKVFDETRGDKTFTFKYGAGEVIKGLDKGLDDMRIGDKRRLTVPAKMAYGSQGVEPTVPPNAQLEFEVELVNITE